MKKIYILLTSLLTAQIVLAFFCGPFSCEWGNSVYFYSGVTSLLIAFILPLFQNGRPWSKRFGFGLLFLLSSVIVWAVGFIAGDFRIMCRLF